MKNHRARTDSGVTCRQSAGGHALGPCPIPGRGRVPGIKLFLLLAVSLGFALHLGSIGADPKPDPATYDPGIPSAAASEIAAPIPVPAGSATPVVTNPPASAPLPVAVGATPGANPGATNETSAADSKPLAMDALDDKHRLAVGDRVSFRIVEDEEEPKSLVVADSGELEVPYIGRFLATEKTCKELAKALKAELEKDYYYQATVLIGLDLMARSRGKVYLVGPVRAPGPQEIPSDEVLTLSKAILRAGGFLETADKKNVRVTRKKVPGPGEETSTVNVADILEKGKTEGDMVLQIGDLIYVPERLIRF